MLFCLISTTALAQAQRAQQVQQAPDARLLDVYDAAYLQRLQAVQPALLERMNYYLDHSYSIALDNGKMDESLPTIAMPTELSAFNVLKMERERKIFRQKEGVINFRIQGTNQILSLDSETEFVKKFNAATGRTYPTAPK